MGNNGSTTTGDCNASCSDSSDGGKLANISLAWFRHSIIQYVRDTAAGVDSRDFCDVDQKQDLSLCITLVFTAMIALNAGASVQRCGIDLHEKRA